MSAAQNGLYTGNICVQSTVTRVQIYATNWPKE